MVPQVRVDNATHHPDGTLYTAGMNMGVEVTLPLLQLNDDVAIEFAVAHELGHAFSDTLLTSLGLAGLDGAAPEIIADLGSAYLLSLDGRGWPAILNAARDGIRTGIFTVGWSGEHPPGAERAQYVQTLHDLMAGGHDFNASATGICLSVQGYRNPNGHRPPTPQTPSLGDKVKAWGRGVLRYFLCCGGGAD
jgi:hypothetical protein